MLSGSEDNLATVLVLEVLLTDLFNIIYRAIKNCLSEPLPVFAANTAQEHRKPFVLGGNQRVERLEQTQFGFREFAAGDRFTQQVRD
jgi:hypothetical protein